MLGNVAMFGGGLDAALVHGDAAIALSRAAGDTTTELMALVDSALAAAYAGRSGRAAEHAAEAARLAERLGSPLARGWAAYAEGERRAELGDPTAAGFLEDAVRHAGQVDAVFLAGVARHTLLTTAARADERGRSPAGFAPLLDTWHGMGAWTQLWIAVRALAEALSRLGRHADAAVLLGALRASPRAGIQSGGDAARVRAVETAARAALGTRFAPLAAEGAALGDAGAVAQTRRLTRGRRAR